MFLHPYASTIMFGYGSFVVVLKPKSVSPLNLSFFFFSFIFISWTLITLQFVVVFVERTASKHIYYL